MHAVQRLLATLWSTLARALRLWARDIARRKTLLGKAASAILGLLVIVCACSLLLGAVRGAGEAVGLLPTRTPTSAPTARPAATATPRAAPTRRPVPTTAPPQPTTPPAPAPSVGDSPALPPGLPSATIARVIDGDTVDVTRDGQTLRVRLIGIDTPETVDPRKPVECFGREASARAHELLDGQVVLLEDDLSQGDVDRYGRALCYLNGAIGIMNEGALTLTASYVSQNNGAGIRSLRQLMLTDVTITARSPVSVQCAQPIAWRVASALFQ
jgi:endonuclease YncB( thermonuclease family)